MSKRGRSLFILLKRDDDLKSCRLYSSSFDKIYVIIVCYEDIYGRYCIHKSNIDHFQS